MGFRSVTFGHIQTRSHADDATNRQMLQSFPFDDLYPFPNIFHLEDPPRYKAPSIIFGGTFKQIEDDWLEWMSCFARLLSLLEAVEANVILDCYWGRYAWTLVPASLLAGRAALANAHDSLVGQQWWIVQAPELKEDVRQLLHPAQIPVQINPDHCYGY